MLTVLFIRFISSAALLAHRARITGYQRIGGDQPQSLRFRLGHHPAMGAATATVAPETPLGPDQDVGSKQEPPSSLAPDGEAGRPSNRSAIPSLAIGSNSSGREHCPPSRPRRRTALRCRPHREWRSSAISHKALPGNDPPGSLDPWIPGRFGRWQPAIPTTPPKVNPTPPPGR